MSPPHVSAAAASSRKGNNDNNNKAAHVDAATTPSGKSSRLGGRRPMTTNPPPSFLSRQEIATLRTAAMILAVRQRSKQKVSMMLRPKRPRVTAEQEDDGVNNNDAKLKRQASSSRTPNEEQRSSYSTETRKHLLYMMDTAIGHMMSRQKHEYRHHQLEGLIVHLEKAWNRWTARDPQEAAACLEQLWQDALMTTSTPAMIVTPPHNYNHHHRGSGGEEVVAVSRTVALCDVWKAILGHSSFFPREDDETHHQHLLATLLDQSIESLLQKNKALELCMTWDASYTTNTTKQIHAQDAANGKSPAIKTTTATNPIASCSYEDLCPIIDLWETCLEHVGDMPSCSRNNAADETNAVMAAAASEKKDKSSLPSMGLLPTDLFPLWIQGSNCMTPDALVDALWMRHAVGTVRQRASFGRRTAAAAAAGAGAALPV